MFNFQFDVNFQFVELKAWRQKLNTSIWNYKLLIWHPGIKRWKGIPEVKVECQMKSLKFQIEVFNFWFGIQLLILGCQIKSLKF